MQELEKILEEIEQAKREPWYRLNNYDVKHRLDETINRIADIIRKHMNDGWIPVDEALPPNVKHEGKFHPKYQVTTKHGVTEGWYDQNKEGWYVFTWFREFDGEVDFDKGNILKISFLSNEANRKQNILTAWQPFSHPYKPERSNADERESNNL